MSGGSSADRIQLASGFGGPEGNLDRAFDDAGPFAAVGIEEEAADGSGRGGRDVSPQVTNGVSRNSLGGLKGPFESGHVFLVHLVDAASTDAVMRMILQERAPGVLEHAGRNRDAGQQCKNRGRLRPPFDLTLDPGIALLQIHSS